MSPFEPLLQFTILYPNEDVVRTAVRGAAAYQLAWFDAHMWAFAEVYGLDELLSEDFEQWLSRRSNASRFAPMNKLLEAYPLPQPRIVRTI